MFTTAHNSIMRNFYWLLQNFYYLMQIWLDKSISIFHNRLEILQMDWWGDVGYMLVYKIFEKMYLVFRINIRPHGKISF